MDDKVSYWSSVAFSSIALLLLVINISLVNNNRHAQDELNQRQATINRAVSLSQANQGLVQALAEIAVKGDTPVKDLLTSQGITVNQAPAKATTDTAAKPAKK